jgi:hypothetical protein
MGMEDLLATGGMQCLAPLIISGEVPEVTNPDTMMRKFMLTLGGIPTNGGKTLFKRPGLI